MWERTELSTVTDKDLRAHAPSLPPPANLVTDFATFDVDSALAHATRAQVPLSEPLVQNARIIVAIDGAHLTLKGTLSRMLGQTLNLPVIESGLFYRAVAFMALQRTSDRHALPQAATEVLENFTACFRYTYAAEQMTARAFWRAQDLTPELLQDHIGEAAAVVAQAEPVRRRIVEAIRRESTNFPRGCVVNGRDAGSVIFPEAAVKIFLAASDPERLALRRQEELSSVDARYRALPISILQKDISSRHLSDAGVTHPARNAVILDSSSLSIAELFGQACSTVMAEVQRRCLGDGPASLIHSVWEADIQLARAVNSIVLNTSSEFGVFVGGTARALPGSALYRETGEAVDEMADSGVDRIVTGGGPGIMEAANRRARERGLANWGVTAPLGREHSKMGGVFYDTPFPCYSFPSRKRVMSALSDAAVFVGGGFGSRDELYDFLLKRQIPESEFGFQYPMWPRAVLFEHYEAYRPPIICVGEEAYSSVHADLAWMKENGMIDPDDMNHVIFVRNAAAIIGELAPYIGAWRAANRFIKRAVE